ncbi:MAG: VIT1/CCC1 transporter family protein [Candidatus Aenigmatarchaeota archaeon]|nr:MAG: VIT1/CCC1 transporter family protein [Candidatus Aenigmarchaeota archaeon]
MPTRKTVDSNTGSNLRDIILGGQDGLVNVLGVILAVASATHDTRVVIIAGLAATFAESISMAAVGYTSSKAAKEYYASTAPKRVHRVVIDAWENPLRSALVIGAAAVVGSLVPLVPFIVLDIGAATIAALVISTLVLFATGFVKNKITMGNPFAGGIEMASIGMLAALAGYAIGSFLGVALYA